MAQNQTPPERRHHLEARLRLCREAVAGPLGYWERQDALAIAQRLEAELAELAADPLADLAEQTRAHGRAVAS